MIEAQTFQQIARDFGTPVYVYEEATILARLNALRQAIVYSPKQILFAMKANSNYHLLDILRHEGVGIDAVSPGEMALALKIGFPRHKILFTGNNIADEEIVFAIEGGVLVNIDSLSLLERFGKRYPKRDICVRINPDVGAGHHDHCITGGPKSKFGIWHSQVPAILEIASRFGLKIAGLHQHIGSQILDPEIFMEAMEALLRVAPQFPELQFIDFGGGLGVPYRSEDEPLPIKTLGVKISQRFDEFCKSYGRALTLVLEPGRFLVAEAGNLLVRVTTVKRNPDGRVFVGVDGGFNDLDRPARYGAYHQIDNLSDHSPGVEVVDIVGHLCESGDKFAEQRAIGQSKEGDLLAIRTAGAYGFSMSSNYNLRPRPAEVLVCSSGEIMEIRKREDIQDIIGIG